MFYPEAVILTIIGFLLRELLTLRGKVLHGPLKWLFNKH